MEYFDKYIRNRHNSSQTIGEVLGEFTKKPELKDGFSKIKLMEAWPKVVGSAVVKHTTKIYFNKGFLNVYLSSSIVRNELLMRKDKIKEQLNNEIGRKFIYDINFR